MPFCEKIDKEAAFRFIMRATVCSEFRSAFANENFDRHIPRYYARWAVRPHERELREIMTGPRYLEAMETLYGKVKDRIKVKGCVFTYIDKYPRCGLAELALGALILVAAIVDGIGSHDVGTSMLPSVLSGLAGVGVMLLARRNLV